MVVKTVSLFQLYFVAKLLSILWQLRRQKKRPFSKPAKVTVLHSYITLHYPFSGIPLST